MKPDWRTEWPMWLVLAGTIAYSLASWNAVPDRFAVHWNLAGEPDGFAGRAQGLLALPLTALALYAVMLVLPRVDPGRANYESFAGAYRTIRLLVLLVVAVAQVCLVIGARGTLVALPTVTLLAVGALCVVIGNLLGKLRPNWFAGIRTPWTLSSKESWLRTHRVGGWAFVADGLLIMAMAAARIESAKAAAIAVMAATALGLAIYSYVVWRGDPAKVPPAGTLPAPDPDTR